METHKKQGVDLITLTFDLIKRQQEHKEATGDFTLLLVSIQTACKFISSKVRKAGLANLYGLAGNTNTTGDVVKKLDVLSNEVFINTLKNSKQVCAILSEEEKDPIFVDPEGKYVVAFDPLDGSSNIDANVTIGSIFGIWKRLSPVGEVQKEDLMQKGNELISAGFCVYGSSTQMIICIDKVVNGYTLDPSLGEFILTHPSIKMPISHPIYSINEGNAAIWDETITNYVKSKKNPPKGEKTYSLRYIGSMVGDVNRTLMYGGIFMYPADIKSPEGKLRLLYECAPMAYIIQNAGGKATTGTMNILDIMPKNIHQRAPIIIGSIKDVEEVEELYDSIKP
jgi:fructose-1,6-bisphosphatase I